MIAPTTTKKVELFYSFTDKAHLITPFLKILYAELQALKENSNFHKGPFTIRHQPTFLSTSSQPYTTNPPATFQSSPFLEHIILFCYVSA